MKEKVAVDFSSTVGGGVSNWNWGRKDNFQQQRKLQAKLGGEVRETERQKFC